MSNAARRLLGMVAACAALSPARAQEPEVALQSSSMPAAGLELWASTDSDKTDVVKLLGRASWRHEGADQYQGIAVEQAWFRPQGQKARKDERIYVDLADRAGDKWLWKARLGTDGKTWLGSANLRRSDWSKEFFLEREIVETPRGVDEGIYYTFVGASLDFPVNDRNTFNAMAGVQEFTGRNERLHLRGSYVHVAMPELGLSAQLRGRYFHSTAPGEFDYYSPENFVQLLPVVQMRRFTSSGWMVLAAAGYGAQRATGGNWRSARLAELRVESPRGRRDVQAFGQLQYSNNSLSGAGDFHYVLARFGLTVAF